MIIAWLKGTALPLRLHAPPGALPPSSFVFFFVRSSIAHRYRPQFLTYRYEIVQAHCHRGGIGAFVKILGGRTPLGGKFFPNFFSRYRFENVRESCP